MRELELCMENIELASGHMESLMSIKTSISKDKNIDIFGLEMARIATNKIASDLCIENVSISTESFGDRTVSLEGLKLTIGLAIDAVIKFIKKLYAKLNSLLGGMSKAGLKSTKALKKALTAEDLDEDLDVVITDKAVMESFSNFGPGIIELDVITERLKKIPSEIATINRYLDEKSLVVTQLEKVVSNALFTLQSVLYEAEENPGTDPTAKLDKVESQLAELKTFAGSNFPSILAETMEHVRNLPLVELEAKDVAHDVVDIVNSFKLADMTEGKDIYFISTTSEDRLYPVIIRKDRVTRNLEGVRATYPTVMDLHNVSGTAFSKLDDLSEKLKRNSGNGLMLERLLNDLKNLAVNEFLNTEQSADNDRIFKIISLLKNIMLNLSRTAGGDYNLLLSMYAYIDEVTHLTSVIVRYVDE